MDRLNGDFNRGYTKALVDVSNFFDNYPEALTGNRLYTQKGIRAVLDFILANREELRETGSVKDIVVRKDKKDPVLEKRAGNKEDKYV